jgi:hypothetical protein
MSHTPSTLSAYSSCQPYRVDLCQNKFLSPKIGVSCWIRTNARDPTLIVRVKNRTPLYLRHNCLVDRRGIEPRLKACKAPVLPLSLSAQTFIKHTNDIGNWISLSNRTNFGNVFNKWYSERVSIPLLRLERAAF